MITEIHNLYELKTYKFVVILAKHNGEWIFCKHKERKTWETAGGHIEEREKPLEAAKRELREETGAEEFTIKPIFDYWVSDGETVSNGMAFYAEISVLGKLPLDFEMQKISHFKEIPQKLTYPEIVPALFKQYQKLKLLHKI